MKKENYMYLSLSIVLLILWILDVRSFVNFKEMWEFVRVLYAIGGFFMFAFALLAAVPTTESNETKKNCDICGKTITKDEQSVHFNRKDKDGNTFDYCEKCKDKVKD
jgi:hypothetical protein